MGKHAGGKNFIDKCVVIASGSTSETELSETLLQWHGNHTVKKKIPTVKWHWKTLHLSYSSLLILP